MELKGNFHDLIAQVDDPELLRRMFQQCLGLLKGVDMLEDMPPEALLELEKAISESYENESGVSHEEVKKMFKVWASA
jgi:hypothetical protein